jgi:hypothetical protein
MFLKSWIPVFAVIDLKKTTFKLKDGATGSLVSVAGGAAEWTDSPTTPGEAYYTGSAMTSKPVYVELGGVNITNNEGTLGSLVENEWDWGDQDTLGADTMYIKLPGDGDPDNLTADYLKIALTATAKEIAITIGEGNLTYSENKNIEYILDRGNLDEVREGDQVPLEVSFDFTWEYISAVAASATPTVEEALKNIGEAADWVSSDVGAGAACRPFAVDLEVLYEPTPAACGEKETITFPNFRYETLDHDLQAGTISCTGKCNALMPTAVRVVQ